MNRRQLCKLFSGLVVSGIPWLRVRSRKARIVVAGGGIIGTAIAYYLARRGAEVTLVEKDQPASGATSKSFAWINATFSKRPRHYYELNRLGMAAWHNLQRELNGELIIQWGGSLEWALEQETAQRLRNQVRQHQQWGYATHLIDEETFKRLAPNLVPGEFLAACFGEHEGTLDPVQAVKVLLERAQKLGARVEYPCEITGLEIRQGQLRSVKTTIGELVADYLVVACGVDTPRVVAIAGIKVPLKNSPGVLAHTAPYSRLLDRVALAPGAHIKQNPDGRIITGSDFGGSPVTDNSSEFGYQLLKNAEQFLPGIKNTRLERVTLGWRPLPKDEFPIIGFTETCPNLYLAVMHSGVTLAPLIGQLAAIEILDGVRVELLQPYRLARFG